MPFLLDTNIVSALVRDPQGRVTRRIREIGEGEVATSIIVAAELRYGAAKKGSPRLSAQLEAVLLPHSPFCLSNHRPTRSTVRFGRVSNVPDGRSAATIF
jgi:predicted nucleic acid-binding protein